MYDSGNSEYGFYPDWRVFCDFWKLFYKKLQIFGEKWFDILKGIIKGYHPWKNEPKRSFFSGYMEPGVSQIDAFLAFFGSFNIFWEI